MNKKGVFMLITVAMVLLLSLFPMNGLGATELVVNGGFEDVTPFGWIPTTWADEVAFLPYEGRGGSGCVVMGGPGAFGTGAAHVEQTFSPAVYAHTDLTLWAKGYNAPSTLVVWIFYNGYTMTHTKAVTADWSQITIPIDKTTAVVSIRIATYDDLGNIYTGPSTASRYVDDVSMLGGFFVIPEFWLGPVLGLVGMFVALGTFYYTEQKRFHP